MNFYRWYICHAILREDMDAQHLLDINVSVRECPIDMDFINKYKKS